MTGTVLKHSDSLNFIFAGNSTFTVLNTQSGNRFTFKVKRAKKTKDNNTVHFVSVLTGPDIYQFIGSVQKNSFRWSAKSKISAESQSVRVFNYILFHLFKSDLSSFIEIWHEGRCGKCGRPLTTPESLIRGIGPECAKNMDKSTARDKKLDYILN